ncbi:nucleic acid-binding protein [Pleomassaria siparia CBS 279.74]|uniref:Nucleic acid-binding protein n=1 Tax=Pleomassaria siparia CBS 279.74 TaxID=1314801 RepID=A0A6G1KFB5_9PLEO|nr:nucleic acid-binding protein [Pleomassaria siparia CBS 279.74]
MSQLLRPTVPIVRRLVSSDKVGVVVSAGKMSRAVKVRIAGQVWDKKIRKNFPSSKTYLVADPNSSLNEGDVVRIASGWVTSKRIRHVVSQIIAPFGAPVEDRPPVLTEDQRMAIRIQERLEKDVRSAERGRKVSKDRIKEARRQGIRIPDLEEAMRNTRLMEEEEKRREAGGGSKIKEPIEHTQTKQEKKREEREKVGEARKAEARRQAALQKAA